jgi:hypothetical protein
MKPYKSHAEGYNWDHNKPENQDGFINDLIKKGKPIKEIEIEFRKRFPKHPNPSRRIRGHINHLKNDHRNFPYCVTEDGRFVLK